MPSCPVPCRALRDTLAGRSPEITSSTTRCVVINTKGKKVMIAGRVRLPRRPAAHVLEL